MKELQKKECLIVSGAIGGWRAFIDDVLTSFDMNKISCMGGDDEKSAHLICHGVDGKDRGWDVRDDEDALECAIWFCCGRTSSEANDSFIFKDKDYQCKDGRLV